MRSLILRFFCHRAHCWRLRLPAYWLCRRHADERFNATTCHFDGCYNPKPDVGDFCFEHKGGE